MRLSEAQESRLKRFLNDKETFEILFSVIQDSFLKPRSNKEVHYLAAKSLSLEFLEDARKDLERHRVTNEDSEGGSKTSHV